MCPHPWAPVLAQVLQTLQVAAPSRCCTRVLVPWAPALVQVLQTLQVAPKGRCLTRILIPWAPVLVGVFQTLQVAIASRPSHVPSSHGHPFSCTYFKHSRWPSSAAASHALIPWAPVLVQASNTPGGHRLPLLHTFSHSMGTRSRASTSNTPGGRLQPLLHTFPRRTGTRSRGRISNTLVGHASRCFTHVLNPWAPVLV